MSKEKKEEKKVEKATRELKTYVLASVPTPKVEAGKKDIFAHPHIRVISEAISALVDQGIKAATQEDIMAEAVAQGLYEQRTSTQGTKAIFSWWRKPLREAGFIA